MTRNDAKGCAQAAHAVNRADVVTLLRSALAARLPKVRADRFVGYNPTASEVARRSQATYAADPARFGAPSTGIAKARRSASRTDFATRNRIVTLRPYGSWPRAGTARAAKTSVVRDRVSQDNCKVRDLIGLLYTDAKGKTGRITFHDLEVMADKRLILLEDV